MTDSLIAYTQSVDHRIVMIIIAILIFWISLKTIRGIINFCLVILLIYIVVLKIPTVQDTLMSFLR